MESLEIEALMKSMHQNARTDPDYLLVSIDDTRKIRYAYRVGSLNRSHPLPPRKIRKCYMRKREVAMRKGRAHIQRVVQTQMDQEKREIIVREPLSGNERAVMEAV